MFVKPDDAHQRATRRFDSQGLHPEDYYTKCYFATEIGTRDKIHTFIIMREFSILICNHVFLFNFFYWGGGWIAHISFAHIFIISIQECVNYHIVIVL